MTMPAIITATDMTVQIMARPQIKGFVGLRGSCKNLLGGMWLLVLRERQHSGIENVNEVFVFYVFGFKVKN